MPRIAFRFLTGRLHATPWDRHVNEGLVEWPPSPWRLCRALVATGFTKLGWDAPPPAAVELLEALSGVTPVYWLPPASAGHTRHYMPLGKRDPKTHTIKPTKVLDGYAWVGRGEHAVLGVDWPISVSPAAAELLGALLRSLSYLGRAEAWVSARVVEALPEAALTPCKQAEACPGPGMEAVPLLAPMRAADYLTWRTTHRDRALEAELRVKQNAARAKGKPAPAKLSRAQAVRVEARYPEDLVSALLASTGELRKIGWSQPPGTRRLTWWRPVDALQRPTPRPRRKSRRPMQDTALLALRSDTEAGTTLPLWEQALWQGERLHQALVRRSDRGPEGPAPCFTGSSEEGRRLVGHAHAIVMPLALDRRADAGRRIDHFLVHAPMNGQGFSDRAIGGLLRVRRTYAKDTPDVDVTLAGLGVLADFERVVPAVSSSRGWRTVTPFIPPRHLKPRGKNDLEGQVLAELEAWGHGDVHPKVEIQVESAGRLSWHPVADAWALVRARQPTVRLTAPPSPREASHHVALASGWRRFEIVRRSADRPPPQRLAVGVRLTFDAPVRGPLCLGYGAHFGLGAFEPEP